MKNSAIEWCHHTFNPWIGCTKVSPGCKNCYAAALDNRWGHDRWGVGKERDRTTPTYWKQPLAWDKEAQRLGERHRVFCASLADVFDAAISDVWRFELFDLIRTTPNLDWLLLTKRPENFGQLVSAAIDAFTRAPVGGIETRDWLQQWLDGAPPQNVWMGTTVEDQVRADERIPLLIKIPAVVRFLSCEPLLEAVSFGHCVAWDPVLHSFFLEDIHWVICGGESGAGARPMNVKWARQLRDQCSEAAVPFLFKQWGDHDAKGVRVGKKVAGRTLDGVIHDGYPLDAQR